MLGALLYLTLYFQIVLGLSPVRAGLASLPMTVAITAVAPVVSRLLGVVGPRLLMSVGPLLAAVGLFLISRLSVDGSYWSDILPGQLLLGAGLAFVVIPLQNLALAGVESRDAGVASAAVTATQQIGGSIGAAVFTAVYSSTMAGTVINAASPGLPALVIGYSTVFLAAAIAMACAAPIAWGLITVDRRTFAVGEAPVHLG